MKQKHFDNNNEPTGFCLVCENTINCGDIRKWFQKSITYNGCLESEYLIMPKHLSFIKNWPFCKITNCETSVALKRKIRTALIAMFLLGVSFLIVCLVSWGVIGLFVSFIPCILITYIPLMMMLEMTSALKYRLIFLIRWIVCAILVSIVLLIVGSISGNLTGFIIALIPSLMMTYIPIQLLIELHKCLHLYKMRFTSIEETCVDWYGHRQSSNIKETATGIWNVLLKIVIGRLVIDSNLVSDKFSSIELSPEFKSVQYSQFVIYRIIKGGLIDTNSTNISM